MPTRPGTTVHRPYAITSRCRLGICRPRNPEICAEEEPLARLGAWHRPREPQMRLDAHEFIDALERARRFQDDFTSHLIRPGAFTRWCNTSAHLPPSCCFSEWRARSGVDKASTETPGAGIKFRDLGSLEPCATIEIAVPWRDPIRVRASAEQPTPRVGVERRSPSPTYTPIRIIQMLCRDD